jgi:hypothetical protein
MKITPTTLPRRIAEIDGMDRAGLLDFWREVQGAPPPKHLAVGFMRKALIYETQCRALGGPKIRSRASWRRGSRHGEAGRRRPRSRRRVCRPPCRSARS